MKIQLLITTYNRPDLLLALLRNIESEKYNHTISLLIVDDCSTKNYSKVYSYLDKNWRNHFDYFKTDINYGKKDYWQLINFAYNILQKHSFDYLIQLPDDVLLVKDFFDKAIETFDVIPDHKKACLNILNDYSRNGKSMWTNQEVKDLNFSGTDLLKTGWVDMCFISSKNYLRFLDFKIDPINHSWSKNKHLSSGVGKQISQRLVSSGYRIYQVKHSLIIHDDHPSVMHPEHRKHVQLMTNHITDKITATMATMPGREESLVETVNSIINQVDELHIYMNNISTYPQFASNKKIKLFFSKDYMGDLGDAGKFYTADEISGYHFTIDDDIIYPPDYVNTMIAAIEKHDRKCIVSLHGRNFNQLPVDSYYLDHSKAFSCVRTVDEDVFAHVIGTGVLAYHTDTIKLHVDIFEFTNMADIWFSKYCNDKNIPRLIVAHKQGWIKLSKKYDQRGSIFTHQSINDKKQTEITNSVKWSTVL